MRDNIYLRVTIPLSFFMLIGYIIFLANSADYNFAFKIIGEIAYGDKLMHGLLYGIMAWCLNYGLGFRTIYTHIQLGATIVLTFALLEEISQIFIPSRTFDMIDILADVIGVVLFSLIRSNK